MKDIDSTLESVTDIINTAAAVKGEKFADFCKFSMNVAQLTKMIAHVTGCEPDAMKFSVLVCTELTSAHARALGLVGNELTEALDLSKSIIQRLDQVSGG